MSALRSFVSSRIFKLPHFVPRWRIGDCFPIHKCQLRLCALLFSILPNFAARGMASPVRLLYRVQVVLALLHFAISVIQEVSVNSFPVTPFLMAIQAVTGLTVLVRRPVPGFVTGLLMLVHSCSHFVLFLDT